MMLHAHTNVTGGQKLMTLSTNIYPQNMFFIYVLSATALNTHTMIQYIAVKGLKTDILEIFIDLLCNF